MYHLYYRSKYSVLETALRSTLLVLIGLLLTTKAYADKQLFSDSFESAEDEVWSTNVNQFRLTSTSDFSHSGGYSAHNVSGNNSRAGAVQEFAGVSSGKLRVSWWVLNNGADSNFLASFSLSSNGPTFELYQNDLWAIPRGGFVSGLASPEVAVWQQLSIVHDFDESVTRFYFQGNEVLEFPDQIDALNSFSMYTDGPNVFIDDVEVIHQVTEDAPSNVDLVMDAFSNGTTEGWNFDHPQLVAVDTFSHQGSFSVHKPLDGTGTHGLRREFDAQSTGLIETSWWILANGSEVTDAALFNLGDALTFSLQDGGRKLSLSAIDSTSQDFQPEVRNLPNGVWFKLGINYNFETNMASFLLDNSVIHDASIEVQAFTSLTLTSDDSTVYIDEIMINNSAPASIPLEPASIAVETEVSEIGIALESRVENARVVASWTEVPSSDGYRLYYHAEEFSDVTNIQFFDFGTITTVDTFLPYGSSFHIAIGAYKDGENIALSNRELVDIPVLEPKLTTLVDDTGNFKASWEFVPDVENHRIYYHSSEFTSTENIAFVDLGRRGDITLTLEVGSNYYIALAIKTKDNPYSKLSKVEQVSYYPGIDNPIFPPPPSIDPSRIVGCCSIRAEQMNGAGSSAESQLLPLPVFPAAPTLEPLMTFSGDSGKTVIAANSLTSFAPFNEDTTKYFPLKHDTVFPWGSFGNVETYNNGFSRPFIIQDLSFGISINFDEKDYGRQVGLSVVLGNDVGDLFYLARNRNWYKIGRFGFTPGFASGVASAGTHTILGLPYPPGMFGEMRVGFFYEVDGLGQLDSKIVITEDFEVTFLPAFNKLDNDGNLLPKNSSDWACVQDTKTGLVWEAKTHDGGLRDAKHTYTWFSSDSSLNIPGPFNDSNNNGQLRGMVPNGGDCADSSNCDTEKYINQVNATGLCGANDWRMPAPIELNNLAQGFLFSAPWYQSHYLNDAEGFFWTGLNALDDARGYGLDWAFRAQLSGPGSSCTGSGLRLCRALMSSKNRIYAVRTPK